MEKKPSSAFQNKFVRKMEHIQEKMKDDLDDEVRSAFSANQTIDMIESLIEDLDEALDTKGGSFRNRKKRGGRGMIQKGGEIFTKARIRTILLMIVGLVVLGAGLKGIHDIYELREKLKKYAKSDELQNNLKFYSTFITGCRLNADGLAISILEKNKQDTDEDDSYSNYTNDAEHSEGNHFHSNNPYEVLNVQPSDGLNDIKKAYRDLSRKEHPDKNHSNKLIANENMVLISAAFEKIFKLKKRAEKLVDYKDKSISGLCATINQIHHVIGQIFNKGDTLLMISMKYGGLAVSAGLAAKNAASAANHVLDAAVETIYYTINNFYKRTKSGDIKILIPPAIKNNVNMSQLSIVEDFK